jgi:hypothetical protein
MKRLEIVIGLSLGALAAGCIDFSKAVDDYCQRFPMECGGSVGDGGGSVGGGGGSVGGGGGSVGGGGGSIGGGGGSDAGDADAGGADAGGTDAGGTDAGGTDAGGTDAGGTDAGPAQYLLTLVAPSGGVVRPDGGQPCPGFCTPRMVDVGASVSLLAEPAPQHVLGGWTGECSFAGDAGACEFAMPARDVTVSATFVPLDTLTLTVSSVGGGDGQVTIMPGSFTCTPAFSPCAVMRPRGTMLQLVATPESMSTLTAWSPPCNAGNTSCSLTLAGDISIGATFERLGQLQVTVNPTATGARVASADGGIDCPGRCTHATAGPVTLTAIERPGVLLQRWDDNSVALQRTVQVSSGATTQVTATFEQVNLIFFTSDRVAFSSAQEADRACRDIAADAGLGSAYVAWLSTPDAGALNRILAVSPALLDAGWVRMDNRPFTRSLGRLVTNDEVLYPVSLDEHGTRFDGLAQVATGSTERGEAALPCFDGVNPVSVGSPLGGSLDWTRRGLDFNGCNNLRLYCLGTAHRAQPPLRQVTPRRRAFLAASAVSGTDGLPGGDQMCALEAFSAGLQGSFKALLGFDGGAPVARFDAGSPGWYRIDGVPWAVPASELWANQPRLQSALNVSAGGAYLTPSYVWTLAFTPSTPGDTSTICGSSAANGVVGNPLTSGDGFFQGNGRSCSDQLPVYCLEE